MKRTVINFQDFRIHFAATIAYLNTWLPDSTRKMERRPRESIGMSSHLIARRPITLNMRTGIRSIITTQIGRRDHATKNNKFTRVAIAVRRTSLNALQFTFVPLVASK